MSPFTLIGLLVVVCGVVARPTEKPSASEEETVDGRQGWNQGQPLNAGYGGSAPGYPAAVPPVGAYPPPNVNGRPSYAYDNAFRDQVNFSGADLHSNLASAVNNQLPIPSAAFLPPIHNFPIQNQVSGFVPAGYSAPTGISASAAAFGKI